MAEVTGMTPEKISQEITKEINNLKAYATDDIGTGPTNANKFVKLDSEGKIFIATASITGGGDPTNKAYVDKGLNDKADKTHVDNATSNIGNTNSNNANKLVKLNSEGKVFIATASITSGGDPVNKAYVDSLSPLKSFAGAGSPEGEVSAPVGSIYTDTAATSGAIRWIKSSGTGSTGWQVNYGDTGWRDITSLLTNGWTAEIFRIRRQGNTVTLEHRGLRAPEVTNLAWGVLPAGFADPRTMIPITTRGGITSTTVSNSLGCSFHSMTNFTLDTYALATSTWTVRAAWPATLPSIPA